METKKFDVKKLVYAAVCLALAMVLPFLTGQIPEIGKSLQPMHIAIFLCGFLCGWQYGVIVGFVSPYLRSLIFGRPNIYPDAVGMAFELLTYGLISGLMYKYLPKKARYIYVSLITAMIGGRIVWGIARYIMAGISGTTFPFSAFISGAITTALPGIALHLVLVPLVVIGLKKAKIAPTV